MNAQDRTYVRAAMLLVPTFFFWFFADIFLLPKVLDVWRLAGLNDSGVQWIMDGSYAFMHHGRLIFASVIVAVLLLEFYWPAWPHYRRTAVACITLFFHTAVLCGITAICIAALLAVPLLARIK